MVEIKNLLTGFKKFDILIGIAVGLLALAFFTLNLGWVLLLASALAFTIISVIMIEKSKSKPDIITMLISYGVVLVLGMFAIKSPTVSLSPVAGFLASLFIGFIYALIVLFLTAFFIFIVALIVPDLTFDTMGLDKTLKGSKKRK